VTCDLTQTTLHGYCDGELDAVRAAEFEHHLEHCSECRILLLETRALGSRLRQNDLYQRSSDELRQRVEKQLGLARPEVQAQFQFQRPTRTGSLRWLLVPAFAVATVAIIAVLARFPVQQRVLASATASELIDAHVRSLQPGHLTDVISTDQHTVKPWFDGKLDFIPPVNDYTAQGFSLVGGRLDVLNGHDVAALVYARRKHTINLFVWPARQGETALYGWGSREGYNWGMWQAGDMRFCLVSDAAQSDLHELQQLIHP
jgi:anti-sigma factor RsiW